jgi:hypothetical protein
MASIGLSPKMGIRMKPDDSDRDTAAFSDFHFGRLFFWAARKSGSSPPVQHDIVRD